MKFIHAADLHIDSQLKGLDAYGRAPAERIRAATRDAVVKLVDLALREQVDFVVIAGDIFDGPWPDATTGAWTASEFRRLHNAGVPVFLLRGNHDAHSQIASTAPWAPSVREFRADRPETFVLDDFSVALHGQGFARREAPHDLAAAYPERVDGLFNIGVLHTSLAGDPQHDSYAPTTEHVLTARGYDYWALGHIHKRRIVRETGPTIVYPGNTQGRHINESGAKGCYVVRVENQQLVAIDFHATDVVRWSQCVVEASEEDDPESLRAKLNEQLERIKADAEGRLSAVRATIRGRCQAHRRWRDQAARDEWEQEIRHLDVCRDDVWIEKLRLETQPVVDREQLRASQHLLGDLLRLIDSVRDDEQALRELAESFKPLTDRAGADLKLADIDWESPGQIRSWLDEAETTLISQLWEESDA